MIFRIFFAPPTPAERQSPRPNLHYIRCPFWTKYDFFLPIFLFGFEDFFSKLWHPHPLGVQYHNQMYTTYRALYGQIMTFFGRYSSVILRILDILWHLPEDNHHDQIYTTSGILVWFWGFWTNYDIFWPIFKCDFGLILSFLDKIWYFWTIF